MEKLLFLACKIVRSSSGVKMIEAKIKHHQISNKIHFIFFFRTIHYVDVEDVGNSPLSYWKHRKLEMLLTAAVFCFEVRLVNF